MRGYAAGGRRVLPVGDGAAASRTRCGETRDRARAIVQEYKSGQVLDLVHKPGLCGAMATEIDLWAELAV